MTCSDDACHKIWRVGLEDEEDNKEVIIRGQAEVVERYCLERMKIETTPSSRYSNIHQETTPNSDEHKASVLTIGKNKFAHCSCKVYANEQKVHNINLSLENL